MEEIQTRDGLITNASFTDYLIPTALDMPPVVAVLVEEPEPDAPYGVKGVGEPPTVVSTAAVGVRDCAARDTRGVRRDTAVAASRPGRALPLTAQAIDRPRCVRERERRLPAARSARPRSTPSGRCERSGPDAEEPVAVDHRRHHQVAGDDEPDRRGDADPRRGDGDREHDEDAQRSPPSQSHAGSCSGGAHAGEAAAQTSRAATAADEGDEYARTRPPGRSRRARRALPSPPPGRRPRGRP